MTLIYETKVNKELVESKQQIIKEFYNPVHNNEGILHCASVNIYTYITEKIR